MRAEDVVALMRRLEAERVTAWLDGGWAVDALVGTQTREHSDLDLVVDDGALDRARALLRDAGYAVIREELPASVAYRHPGTGDEVDLHPVRLTPDGGGDQHYGDARPPWHYGAPVTGSVGGEAVRTCDLATQLRAHVGYDPRPVDHADMAVLRARFGCDLPEPYG